MAEQLVIATRGSKLALWQSEHVKASLIAAHPDLAVTLKVISTKGDRIQSVSLSKIGDKGLFTLELEEALRAGEADIAVHSLKDLPTALHSDFAIAATLERADPRDLLIATAPIDKGLDSLPQGARLGTSSLRRRAQAAALRPDLQIGDLRGNVDTRLRKLQNGEHDAIILAAAGLLRLGFVQSDFSAGTEWQGLHFAPLEKPWVAAVGQGAIAVEARAGDERIAKICAAIHHAATAAATDAERAFMRTLEGGCQAPLAAHAAFDGDHYHLQGAVYSLNGETKLADSLAFPADQAVESGEALARRLLEAGAREILSAARETHAAENETP